MKRVKNERISYGIICIRSSNIGLQMLMVKKLNTYYFCEFVLGHYLKCNDNCLVHMFNNMTCTEKMQISTLRFENIWESVYGKNSRDFHFSLYANKKEIFDTTFLKDKGKRLNNLLKRSTNVDGIWEFPKGKMDEKEMELNTAIREFSEETQVSHDKYTVLWNMKPYIQSYVDFKCKYKNVYYFAVANGNWNPPNKFNGNRIECVSCKWINKKDISLLGLGVFERKLCKMFNIIEKKYKNYTKSIGEHKI